MKKSFLTLAVAVMCAFCVTSCEEMGDLDLVGHIYLTAVNPTGGDQAYADSTRFNFNSALCNVSLDSVTYEDTVFTYAGTIMVGSTQTLLSDDLDDLVFPICGINLRDTNEGVYNIQCPINDFSFFEYLDTTDVNALITSGLTIGDVVGNIFAVAVSDTAFYIGHSGTVTLTSYGRDDLSRVVGTVDNVEAIYVTASQVEELANMTEAERAGITDLASRFPHITFYGEISSMRANIDAVLDALDRASK